MSDDLPLLCNVADVDAALLKAFNRFFAEQKKKLSELKDLIQEELSEVPTFHKEM